MAAAGQPGRALALAAGCDCCADETVRDESWRRAACAARRLSWVSLAWMCVEGAVGLWQGLAVGSAALTGWALGSVVEGLASVIVIWRFTGSRTVSQTAERRAQRGVAVSFWLLAPYIAAESARDLAVGHRAGVTVIGIVLTAVALIAMPLLAGLALTAAWPGGWWLDPVIGLGIAAVAVREGTRSWHGDGCC